MNVDPVDEQSDLTAKVDAIERARFIAWTNITFASERRDENGAIVDNGIIVGQATVPVVLEQTRRFAHGLSRMSITSPRNLCGKMPDQ